jgi:hypothetical protein
MFVPSGAVKAEPLFVGRPELVSFFSRLGHRRKSGGRYDRPNAKKRIGI